MAAVQFITRPFTMIERVAQAMHHGDRPHKPWLAASEETRLLYLDRAQWAVEEMREPTGRMKDAGAATYGIHNAYVGPLPNSVIDGQPSKAWRAMIDAAMGEE